MYLIACESKQYRLTQKHEHEHVMPPNSIKVGDDLYYIPIGKDDDGCMMYQAKSNTMMTLQAIIYQNGSGKFLMSKDRQRCL